MVVLFGGHVMVVCFPPQTWTFSFSQCSGSLCQRQQMFIISAACSFYIVNFTGLINGNPILQASHREIFSCTNMPTEVSTLDLTPEWLHRWEAQIATQQHPIRRLHVAPQDTSTSPHHHTHTRKRRKSRLWSITVFTWARLPSKKVIFYRNQGDVGAFKGYCISTYIQESALFSCFTAWAPWHRSELLKALPCLLLGSLHVWYPIPRQFLSLQFPSPPPPTSRKRVCICSSSWRSALGCLRPLTVFYFQRLILRGEKIFAVAIDSFKRHEKSSSFSVKNKSYFLKVILCK